MAMQPNLSAEEFVECSRILIYHIRIYIETLLELEKRGEPIGWDTVNNALLESHLMNARILLEFLAFENKPGYVRAGNYIDDWASIVSADAKNKLKKHSGQISERLVHLTTLAKFESKSQQKWTTRQLFNDLLPTLEQFLEIVPNQRMYEGKKEEAYRFIRQVRPGEIRPDQRTST